jgi:pimeloyl-ACP methyl ester carboxylesterase
VSTLDIAGNRFHLIDEGDQTPLVFLHGFPLDHTMWKQQRAAFQATHRVIIPDLRGFGQSTAAVDAISLADHADDLNAMLDQLGVHEPIVLCALSMGGYIAFRFWEKHAGRVQKLILCDTKSAADSTEAAKGRIDLAEKVMQRGAEVMADAMLPKFFAPDVDSAIVEETKQTILQTSPKTIAVALRAMATRPDSTPLLGSINVPTLVIVGEHDTITKPDEMQSLAAAIPGAEFVQVPDAGHMAPLEQPAVVNEAIRKFLK